MALMSTSRKSRMAFWIAVRIASLAEHSGEIALQGDISGRISMYDYLTTNLRIG